MCTKFVIYGDFGEETAVVKGMLESLEIPYSFERTHNPTMIPTLSTPTGRFTGLNVIRHVFSGHSG